MISRSVKSKIFSRISATTVLFALIALSLIQYRWVTSSAEKDLTELYRSYSYRIQASISEQFSLFPILGDNPNFLMDINSDEDLREKLVNLLDSDAYGENQTYFHSLSYLKKTERELEYYVYSENSWKKEEERTDLQINEQRRLYLIPDPSDRGKIWISINLPPLYSGSKIAVLIQFDILSFYKNEIEPSLWNENDNYELKWYYDFDGEMHRVNEREYNYSPFRVLSEKLFSSPRSWLIEIPLHVIVFNDEENRMSKIFFDHGKPLDDSAPLPMIYVDVLYNDTPLIEAKEYSLTIQWLLSLLLIIGLGIAYFVIIYQINRLRQMRMREKEFVASVTHELRTPLTVIHSAADNIKSGIVSPKRIEQYGRLIADQSTRLSSMIEGILLFSKLEGKAEQSPHVQRVLFKDIEDNLLIFSSILEKDFNKKISIDFGSLPESALTDRDTIELILTNLISNSAKHAYNLKSEGEIRVKGHVKLPHTLVFTVEDDGTGIEKLEKKHIFEPFFRGDRSFKNQIKGSGLGLYLSFRKAKLLGGSLNVKSPFERANGRIRKGSRFTLALPHRADNGEEIS